MARPQRNNVDYFPFLCDDGNKMFYLEETYGNDGFAVFIKLLRELAKSDFHFLDLSKKPKIMFLSAKCKVDSNTLESIINDLVELEKFDAELWNENKVIWCQDFIDSIQDAYSKRSNDCIDRKSLLLLLESKGLRKRVKSTRKPSKNKSESPVNPQTIVEDTKEEESILTPTQKVLVFEETEHDINLVGGFKRFLEHLEKTKHVKGIESQITIENYQKLCDEHTKDKLWSKITDLDNWLDDPNVDKAKKKKKSVYHCMVNTWLKNGY